MTYPLSQFSPLLDGLSDLHAEMLKQTIELASINSGSLNHRGVNRVVDRLIQMTASLGGEQERVTLKPFEVVNDVGEKEFFPLGDALRITKRADAPLQLLLVAHTDTVFAVDHPFQQVVQESDTVLRGPGVTDLKGGIVIMLKALAILEQSPWAEQVGWEIVFNPDEEIGSPGSAPLLQEAANRAHIGLVYEPCFPNGNLAGQRKGSGNFTAVCFGKAAHAGREHHLGRNAIRSLCDFISAVDQLNGKREGVTVNPGYIHGGGANNIVADRCAGRFNIRIVSPEDEPWCLDELQRIVDTINQRDGIRLELHGGFGRKPKILSTANNRLFSLVGQCADQLGMTLSTLPTGGCCDGNNLAAAGLPNVDTLGVQGGNIHSDQEYMNIDSLVPRAKLSALLLLTLARQQAEEKNQWLNE